MEIKQVKQQSRESKIAWTICFSIGLLACCYCGIFVFPWGNDKWVIISGLGMLFGITFIWMGNPQSKLRSALFMFLITIIAIPGIFALSKLREYYAERQLDKYGIITMGEVVELFKKSTGRRSSHKIDMARVAYRNGDEVVYNSIENRNKYIEAQDRVKLIYSAKDPDIFKILGHYEYEDPQTEAEVIERPPEFHGGMPALYAYLSENVTYPQKAKDQRIAGKVFISFVIAADGSVHDVNVEKGIGGGCDEAAVEAVQNMPKWKPGIQNGKPVRVKYNIPISFSL